MKPIIDWVVWVAAVAFVLLYFFAVVHEASAAHPVTKRNCKNDYFRYCSHTQPGSREIRVCFKTNFKRLAGGCQWAIKKYERRKGE